jgi:hypothetical protein
MPLIEHRSNIHTVKITSMGYTKQWWTAHIYDSTKHERDPDFLKKYISTKSTYVNQNKYKQVVWCKTVMT